MDNVQVIPNTSMIQVAFSRLGIAWQQAKISSIHNKDRGEWVKQGAFDHGMRSLLEDCQTHELIACYTSPENTPARIADMLEKENMQDDFQCVIAEHLTRDSEQVSDWLPVSKVINQHYAEPNVVILKRVKAATKPVLLGRKDASYFQRKPDKGLINKQEIRAVSLAKMQLKRDSIVWDIGAGSGSIGLEAAHLCPQGGVYAIEKNVADYAIVRQNLAESALLNYQVEQGKAPDGLYKWPDADAIFIGGSGGNLADLIRLCLSRLTAKGTLVMNFVTIENLSVATETLKQLAKESAPPLEWHFIQLQVSRSKPILSMQRLQAENPVYIVSASRLIQE
jgi:precorrin-6Y C5,15-methyltransferase (decarboxylating)